jgi:hypothetical protein
MRALRHLNFELKNFIFAFAGVETTFYTMSKKHMKHMKCAFQNAIIALENAKLFPQILTPMLEFVHASKIHVFEFNNFNFAFAGVETTFYTMSKNNKTRLKCEFQNAIQKPTKVDFSSSNLHNNVRACVRICATHLRI